MIFGRPGSGKSTFAKKLSISLNLPLYHLDKYFFVQDWKERDYEEFLKIQSEIIAKDSWIIDGNSLKSLEMRWARAELVLYFNYSRLLCLKRLFKRFIQPDISIDDRAIGCKEIIRIRLVRYMWTFEKRAENQIQNLQAKYPKKYFIQLKSDVDLEKFYLDFSSKIII